MASTFKAAEMSIMLADRLKARFGSSPAIAQSLDTDNAPLIVIGDGVSTHECAVIKIMPTDAPLAKDILGNAAIPYGPEKLQYATEAFTSGNGMGAYLTAAHQAAIDMEINRLGLKVEYWLETNGTAPTASTFTTASKQKASAEPDLYWATIKNQ